MKHTFFLAVAPKAAARTQATCRGRFAQVYTAPAYRAWLDEALPVLQDIATTVPEGDITGDIRVTIEVVVARPKTTKRSRPRGDNDNYEKGVWDAMTKVGAWWGDDDQIVANTTTKRWAKDGETPGYRVTVEYLETL